MEYDESKSLLKIHGVRVKRDKRKEIIMVRRLVEEIIMVRMFTTRIKTRMFTTKSKTRITVCPII